MRQRWDQWIQRTWVQHLFRAADRFSRRGGAHLAAAVTYFSVLSVVPLVMLAFSGLGLVITVISPGLRGSLEHWLAEQTADYGKLGEVLYNVSSQALSNWATIGVFAVVLAAWTGIGWMGNLRRAGRMLVLPDGIETPAAGPWWTELLANLGSLMVFFVGVGLSGGASLTATVIGRGVVGWLGVAGSGAWEGAVRVIAVLVSLAVGVALFSWMFHWFSPEPLPRRLVWIGAGLGSAALTVLLGGAGLLLGAFSSNVSAAVFGPVIVLMIVLNLFATLILFIAAWLGTAVVVEPAVLTLVDQQPEAQPEPVVSLAVASSSMRMGLVTGWVFGAASGAGLGAVIAAVAARWPRRRP
jgi:membrane protein